MGCLNSYWGLAESGYLYARGGMRTCRQMGVYNSVASGCAEAAEGYLKALAEVCLAGDEDAVMVMRTHNLRTLVNRLKEKLPEIRLDSKDCKWLGDYYFEARYPGENFVVVNEADAVECLRITEAIRGVVGEELEKLRGKMGQSGLEQFRKL